MPGLFSASHARRVIHCPPSAVKTQFRIVSEASVNGTKVHKFLEMCAKHGREKALDVFKGDAILPLLGKIDVGKLNLDPAQVAVEVAFLLNLITGGCREVGRSIGRDYPEHTDTEMPGTADLATVVTDGDRKLVYVGDYKTGSRFANTTPPAAENEQGKTLVLMACRAWGLDEGVFELVYVNEDGDVHRDAAEYDFFALEEHERKLRVARQLALVARESGKHQVLQGDWCRYCDAYTVCEAKTGLLKEFAGQAKFDLSNPGEAAGKALLLIELAERVDKELRAFAREAPIPLPDGRVYSVQDVAMKKMKPTSAQEWIAKKFGDGVASAAVKSEPKASWEDLKSALDQAGMPLDTKAFRALQDLMVAEGVAYEKVIQKFGVRKAKE